MGHTRSMAGALVGAVGLSLALGGCAQTTPPAPDESTAPSATSVGPPTFAPGGSAATNSPWFDHVNHQTLAANPNASSRELVDALAAAGFDKAAMEVTFDRTNVDLEADYVIVSVKFGDECLIGQRGGRGYASTIQPLLDTGKCLIGHTQPIDW